MSEDIADAVEEIPGAEIVHERYDGGVRIEIADRLVDETNRDAPNTPTLLGAIHGAHHVVISIDFDRQTIDTIPRSDAKMREKRAVPDLKSRS